jgi:oligoribonuclease NrnB/cAMP/cGMP phosphodiesterase (DHH superfamily)
MTRPSNSTVPADRQAPDVVLYHAECADGFGAAWAIWKRFPNAEFIPVKHGYPPPTNLAKRHVVIVDFTYPRPLLESISAEASSLLVLDHHITAQKALNGFPHARFEQNKSGAVMAWEWTHGTPPPWLSQYIQDKDLWTWSLPASREINAALASYPHDFQTWDGLRRDVLMAEGRAILRHENELVNKIVSEAVLVPFHGATVPAVHSSVLTSQIGERLAKGYPFCLIWHDRDGRRYYSLRSGPEGADVGSIAASYGGGGHTHAAGFSVSLHNGAGPVHCLPDLGPMPSEALPSGDPPTTGRSVPSKKKR